MKVKPDNFDTEIEYFLLAYGKKNYPWGMETGRADAWFDRDGKQAGKRCKGIRNTDVWISEVRMGM